MAAAADGQLDEERRASSQARSEANSPAVLLDDRVGDRQPEPGSLSDLLRREERIENLRLQIIRNAGTIVVDFENDGLLRRIVPRPYHEDAAAVDRQHRLLGIDDQVEQHLL